MTPGSSIPTLIAMSTDPIAAVRVRISNLIKETDAKYAGMVAVSFYICKFFNGAY